MKKKNVYIRIPTLMVCMTIIIASLSVLAIKQQPKTAKMIVPNKVSVIPTETPKQHLAKDRFSLNQLAAKPTAFIPFSSANDEGFESSWFLDTNDANAYLSATYHEARITIDSTSNDSNSVQYSREYVTILANTNYTLCLNASSTIPQNATIQIINTVDQTTILEEPIALTTNDSYFEFTIPNQSQNGWNYRINVLLGGNSELESHTVSIKGLSLLTQDRLNAVEVNQVGYYTTQQKHCAFHYNAGDFFYVRNAIDQSIVYTGAIIHKKFNEQTNEENYYGDFSNLVEPGEYYIQTQLGITSYNFSISDQPYQSLQQDLLKMLYLQRCSMDIDESISPTLHHPACHMKNATYYDTTLTKDVTGGWHDAGDYGRYVSTATKTMNDLIFAYLNNPTNNQSYLDEAHYGLTWLLKMQDDEGGVYSKVVTQNMADYVDPSEDIQYLYLLEPLTIETYDFIATTAIASVAYQEIDEAFSTRLLNASLHAYKWIESHPDPIYKDNPDHFNCGLYRDKQSEDNAFFANAALYVATNDDSYLKTCKQIATDHPTSMNGVSWANVGGYGRYLLLNKHLNDNDFNRMLETSLKQEADSIMDVINGNSFEMSLYRFEWGSNGSTAENGTILSMAYRLTGSTIYENAAIEQISYLLGKNPLGICFVTQYGTNYPHNVHSRLAKSHNAEFRGALVGGPNQDLDDPFIQAQKTNVPPAYSYLDHFESYSTNEITIYWNSALIYLLELTHPN